MPPAYAVRDGGDAKSKKQSMADLKLRRLQELNSRLKEDLERPRVKVAEASMRYIAIVRLSHRVTNTVNSLINYCNQTRDYMVPSVWGQVDKKEDPYNPQSAGSDGCCTVM
jgi:guanine nucleotide-binding protein subunit gamma, fungi